MDAAHSDRTRRAFAVVIAVASALGVAVPPSAHDGDPTRSCCDVPTSVPPPSAAAPPVGTAPRPAEGRVDGSPVSFVPATAAPDRSGTDVGGIAARLHTADGRPVPGDLFMLMAVAGSDALASVYDETPYTHTRGTADDTHRSNVTARTVVAEITGDDLELLEFTSAPAGGPSAGVAYAIAYLDVVSDGAFTGDVRVAATGRIDPHGYVGPINAVDEKTAAAHLAAADVLFSASTPGDDHLAEYGARHVGERTRARNTGVPLREERRLDNYVAWGAARPEGMDVIHVRHLADVAAYLCGAGSAYACGITDLLAASTTEFTNEADERATTPAKSLPAAAR